MAVSVKDMAGRFVLVNRYLTDFLRLDPQEILGHSNDELDHFPPEKLHEWEQQDQMVYTTGARLDSEETYVDGTSLVTHLVTRFPITDAQGMLVAIGSIEMDISKRKQAEEKVLTLNTELEQRVWERTAQLVASNKELAHEIGERKYTEEALRQSEVRFRTLTETADAAILIYQDDCFRYANVTAEVMTGYSRDELQHMKLDDLLHPDYTLPFQERTWRIRSGTQVPARYELKIRTADARERWLTLSVAVIGYDDRPALLLTANDITARKQAEEALRQSEERYRTLVETAPSAVLLTDIDYTIRFCNQQAVAALVWLRKAAKRLSAKRAPT
ncbi:MAG: PAS domain S-box protein [Blastochloris sp.]|nr:PAS domain S-box protein [Blastochloris sp.]